MDQPGGPEGRPVMGKLLWALGTMAGVLVCRLRGHGDLVKVLDQDNPGRMFLRCPRCWWVSPGWDLTPPKQVGGQVVPLKARPAATDARAEELHRLVQLLGHREDTVEMDGFFVPISQLHRLSVGGKQRIQ